MEFKRECCHRSRLILTFKKGRRGGEGEEEEEESSSHNLLKKMFVSIESSDLDQAIQLGVQYMTYLCEEGITCPVLYSDDSFQENCLHQMADSDYLGEAMVHAKQMDFMLNSTSAKNKMNSKSHQALIFVNYLSYGPKDFRIHNKGPTPEVVFHVIKKEELTIDNSLRLLCGSHGINYVPIEPGSGADIRMLMINVHTYRVQQPLRKPLPPLEVKDEEEEEQQV